MNRQFTYSLNRLYDNSTQLGQLLQDNTYKYDNVGCLIYFTTPRIHASQNAAALMQHSTLAYPTLYASALITFNKGGYTNVTEVESRASSLAMPRCSNVTERKHCFEEGRRICSKIGGGMRGNVTVEEIDSRLPELAYNYDEQFHHQYEGIRQTFHHCIGADPQIIEGANLHRMLIEREVRRDEEEPAFFYHSDHLGSAAYLTYHGGVIQTLNYLPYGEDWVEYNFFHPDDTTRLGIYRFNGKDPRKGWRIPLDEIKYNEQKDHESGFHYYGARYYWSEVLTGWLSVDPMADHYLGFSPYQYCRWNPVKRIDVDGLFDTEKEAQKAHKKAVKRFGTERVGEIFNRGTEEKPDFSFLVYGVGKDNKTHGQRDGVWAYRPDKTISNKRSLWFYSLKQRTIGISASFSIGAQVSAGITLGKHVGFNANLSSVDLFSHTTEYSRMKKWEHNTYLIDDYNIHGNRGVGVSVYGIDLGYNCSYDAVGERIDKESMSHSGNIGPIQFGTKGDVSVGVDAAIIFGINIQIISRYAK